MRGVLDFRPALWPPFSLRIQVEDLELIAVDDSHVQALSAVTAEDIYGADIPDHAFIWLKELPLNSLKYRWANRVSMSPAQWSLDLVALRDGVIVGTIDLRTTNFADTRTVETGSFVFYRYQGQGVGTLMRHAVAVYAFDYLGALEMTTAWAKNNPASEAVSRKLGYQITGETRDPGGFLCDAARLTRAAYRRDPQVSVTGHTVELQRLLIG